MTAEEAVSYITSYRGAAPRLGLSRIRELLERLGNPQKKLRFIHVAGTNGKGSACAMFASIFQQAGYRTGLFTSPDLIRFNERMRINGQMISEADLARVTAEIAPAADAMTDHPSEFEISTAVAFQYFLEEKCDIVILEVGMGGVTDSTNVIDSPDVAVTMNIGLEHTSFLGKTLPEIASKKAGIIKPGCTAVCYAVNDEVDQVFRTRCAEVGAAWIRTDFSMLKLLRRDEDGQHILWKNTTEYTLSLAGDQQLRNAAVVLTAIDPLRARGWNLTEEAVREGLAHTVCPARFEILTRRPCIIIDGSHNPQCIDALAENLRAYFPGRKFVFLMGVLADKDYVSMVETLLPYIRRMVCVTPANPRALSASDFADFVRTKGIEAVPASTYPEAVRLADAGSADIVVCGSLYMAGLMREEICAQLHLDP